ncbi:MAG: ornithine carbamoyltransferase [Spirochaetes bacterium]|nr:ornithine carbamoyltransferase [Spirochaetota bacterium]
MKKLKNKDLITVADLSCQDIESIFKMAASLKKKNQKLLPGKKLGLIFNKPSTRTRVSFEVGIYDLGGIGIYLTRQDLQIGRGESLKDTALTLSRYLDGIMIRTYSHEDVVDLARFANIPIINGLTDLLHPCQALSDFFTIKEYKKNIKNLKIGYIGDGNNVAHSLVLLSSLTGVNITLASPRNYFIDNKIRDQAMEFAKKSSSQIILTTDPKEAARKADVLYTDVWVSMGQESEKANKRKIFKGYQINEDLLKLAKDDVIVMHCLPAHRGEEITDSVIDGSHSVVFDQAENRLHTQKAIMALLL